MSQVVLKALVVVSGVACAQLAMTQTSSDVGRLVNLDPSGPVAMGKVRFDASAVFHRGAEDRSYMSGAFAYGVSEGWEVGIRAATAPRGSYAGPGFTISTGGRDVELYGKHAFVTVPGLAVSGGVSFPDTPSQDAPFVTAAVMYAIPQQGSTHRLYVGARGVMRQDSNLWGLSAGIAAPVAPGIEAVGDVTAIVQGNNTISTDSGARTRRAVFGFGLRYTPNVSGMGPSTSFTVGVSNGLGSTTGFGLSPALGGNMALTIGISVRN